MIRIHSATPIGAGAFLVIFACESCRPEHRANVEHAPVADPAVERIRGRVARRERVQMMADVGCVDAKVELGRA